MKNHREPNVICKMLFKRYLTDDFPDANEDQGEEAANHIQDLII